jgi:hypothetical protein
MHGMSLDHATSVRYPVKRKLITVNKAPFINVTSKEQFERLTHRISISISTEMDNSYITDTSIDRFKPDSFIIGMQRKSVTNMTRADWKLCWSESV